MKKWKQGDPRWRDLTWGKNLTMGKYGCLITSLAMLTGILPNLMLNILKKNGCFDRHGLVLHTRTAQVLGLQYLGRGTWKSPTYPTIFETLDYYPQQHFCVWLPNQNIIDPLDGKEKRNPYHITSWRLYKDG